MSAEESGNVRYERCMETTRHNNDEGLFAASEICRGGKSGTIAQRNATEQGQLTLCAEYADTADENHTLDFCQVQKDY